ALGIPLAAVAIVGGTIGGQFAIKTRPRSLKMIFAFTTLSAAGFMLANALLSG
ncbi:MAG: sulfite exporter TauE/SafE family protein, partial [Deltaproteobacteria bacterium]|nr:sulfite exporter TauE/SafE family protein [Deltaproteobacteria bacterium]